MYVPRPVSLPPPPGGYLLGFQVREHPMYHLIKARILKTSNNIDGAIQLLQNAIALPSFKKSGYPFPLPFSPQPATLLFQKTAPPPVVQLLRSSRSSR